MWPVISQGDGKVINYDGVPGPQYDDIATLVASNTPAASFSADGTHLAYVAQRGESWLMWVDGKETVLSYPIVEGSTGGSGHPSIGGGGARSIKFSPAGEHIAYITEAVGGMQQIFIDVGLVRFSS